TFLASIQSYTVNPTLWPYIKFLNPSITETANGAFQGASALGNAIASTVAGLLVNKYSTTKPQMIAAKVLTIFAAFFYFGIELNFKAAVVLLIIFQALCGIAGGFGSVYRTHMSMATAESERAKAFGLAMFASAIGSIVGPRKFFKMP
uniref:Major facilitator superfamily (MFS) profile domain-containing protein n=1 Tax=Panagrolaimus sp. ES5 TaxID=591445 RepID=A0AC34F8H3_9BILA